MNSPHQDLLTSVARGDQDAFARLYDETAARVHGLVVRVLRDPAQSEEVTQEVYLDVWRTAARFDPAAGTALAWLLTIAHRKAVDRVRHVEASRRRDTAAHDRGLHVAFDETAEAVEASLIGREVRDALGQLSGPQRECLELAYFGGHTHAEISQLLRIPLGTAKTRIRDGLLRLRAVVSAGTAGGLELA